MELPNRLRWLTSGRFLRPFSAVVAAVVLAVILYNATFIDRAPPNVTIHLSETASDGKLALTLSSVDVVFNEDVDQETAKRAFSIAPDVKGTFYWQGRQTLIFTPAQKLPLRSTFHVHVAPGVRDTAGNVQQDAYDLTFTTVGDPVVKSVSPAADTQSIAVDSQIKITFDRPMDPQPVLDGLVIEPATPYEPTWNGPVLTLTPTRLLSSATVYTIKLDGSAADLDGNKLVPYEWSFKTVAMGLSARRLVPAPDVLGVSVRTPIAVVFDGPVDKLSVAGAIQISPSVTGSIQVTSVPSDHGPAAQPTATQSAPGDNVVVFTPDQPLQPNTTYTVTMSSAVRRTDGQAALPQSWKFSTGEPPASAINRIVFLSDRGGVSNVWMMNPDGSGQRQVTVELAPVAAFDVNIAGDKIAYAVAGQVKRMNIKGDNVQTTAGGAFEYAPAFTPDGTGLVVARRDGSGNDQGFYRIPLITGTDEMQVLSGGAPQTGSDQIGDGGLTGVSGLPAWELREAFSDDSAWMLVARGGDNALELVDMNGSGRTMVGLTANARPVWSLLDKAFYVVGSDDGGTSRSYWRVAIDGSKTRIGPASGAIAASSLGGFAFLAQGSDGVTHLSFTSATATPATQITSDAAWSERSPWFSPDGSQIVFGRVSAQTPTQSGGIWIMKPEDAMPTNLSPDGVSPRFVP